MRLLHVMIFLMACTLLLFGVVTWKDNLTKYLTKILVHRDDMDNDTTVESKLVPYKFSSLAPNKDGHIDTTVESKLVPYKFSSLAPNKDGHIDTTVESKLVPYKFSSLAPNKDGHIDTTVESKLVPYKFSSLAPNKDGHIDTTVESKLVPYKFSSLAPNKDGHIDTTVESKLVPYKFSSLAPNKDGHIDTTVESKLVPYKFSSLAQSEDVRVEVFGSQFVRTHGTVAVVNSLRNDTAITDEKQIDTSHMNASTGYHFFNRLVVNGQLDFRRTARYPVKEDWLTPMDMELLAEDPIKDISAVAQATYSTITLVPWPSEGTIKTGGKVTARLDLKDGKGRPVKKGGHLVRIWMVQQSTQIKRAIAADDTDLGNGSYVTTLPVLWRGRTEVRAALIRSRDLHRLNLLVTRTMKVIHQVIGMFISGNTEQATLCSFIPVIPGYQELCNLTQYNSGLPWYCGKPSKQGLLCEHWARSRCTTYPRHNWTPLEHHLIFHPSFKTGIHPVPNSRYFSGIADSDPPAISEDNCVPMTPLDSWTDRSPRGYWENSIWYPLTGCPLLTFDIPTTAKYLRDTQIIFMGDSNARFLLEFMQAALKCQPLPGQHPAVADHVQRYAVCKESNSTLTWLPHAYPYCCSTGPCDEVNERFAPAAIMDKIPSTGKYVFVVHLFMHFAHLHNSIYAEHVRHTVRGMRDLLARNPSVKIFLRSPHGLCDIFTLDASDYPAKLHMAVLQHEFRDLRDRVMLLNDWDMTVAIGNRDIHPPSPVSLTLSRMILSHVARTEGAVKG